MRNAESVGLKKKVKNHHFVSIFLFSADRCVGAHPCVRPVGEPFFSWMKWLFGNTRQGEHLGSPLHCKGKIAFAADKKGRDFSSRPFVD